MEISKVHIENFKIFKGSFKLNLNKGINILVGDNEAGKSTIIEAIHLALTGMLNGRYMKSELTQYIFNSEIVAEYIQSLEPNNATLPLPHILIEIYMSGEDLAEFEGDVPGAAARDCGNYLDMNLPLTKIVAKRFLDNTLKNITEEHLVYPD